VGIGMVSDVNTSTTTNTGLIDVRAIVNDASGFAEAIGIGFETLGDGLEVPGVGDTAYVVNDGGIISAAVSYDNGLTFERGTAIDAEGAPNAVQIDLMGTNNDGYIYDDIKLSADDVVNVTNG